MTFMGHIMRPMAVTHIETPPLRLIRYALSGALVGIAGVGTVSWFAGIPNNEVYDIAAAILGFLGVLGVKLARIG